MLRMFSAIRRHRVALASGATLTTAAIVVSTLAVLYEGVPTADLELDDGGVWVTKTDDLLVGHLNYPSRLLDGAVRTRAGDFDVLQDDDRVLIVDDSSGTLTPVDPGRIELTGDTALPAAPTVALGGATVGVIGDGLLFSVPFTGIGGAGFVEEDAIAEIGAGGVVAVSRDGSRVFAASPANGVLVTVDTTSGSVGESTLALDAGAEPSITAVGDQAVVFDAARGVVHLPGGSMVEVPGGAGGVLQQASAGSDAVFVSTPTALVRVPLAGGSPEEVASVDEGEPAAPVVLNGCVYSVWSGSRAYVRDCDGDASDIRATIDADAAASLVLRTNRRVVVVNDTTAGTVWVVNEQVDRIENWDDIVPPPDDESEDEESQEEEPQFQLPERNADNKPPTAEDDEYGVRAGRTMILRVTENDSDPDGDLLAASLIGDPPAGFEITPVLGGAALQATVSPNATGTASLRYVVDDGRGGTDEATVSVTVRGADQNEPPRPKEKVETLQVEVGGTVSNDVLQGWTDPDGDDIYLVSATVGDTGDTVAFRSNGVIEYTAASGVPGAREVAVVVSDGRAEAEGVVRVDVRPAGTLNPIANADRVTATVGVPVTVSPLDNDVSPTGEPLRFTQNDYPTGASVTPNYTDGTFDFQADTPGTYYVQYFVTVGSRSALGIVRIDVIAADTAQAVPIAVRDLALLPAGRDVLVDVLANDSDPAGGILVVQSARSTAGAAIGVEVLQHSILRITDAGGLSAPTTVTYTVSNGAQSAVGEVLVLPVPLPATLRPPVTVDDAAVVRAGDVVSIPVLKNDYHPDNDVLTLLPQLRDVQGIDESAVFVDGDRVRLQAPTEPGTVYFAYDIVDSQQQKVGGYVTVQVIPADAGTNSAPRPKPVIARVVAGNSIRIAIPLDGIDDDGDSVELTRVTSIPGKGRVTVGDSWLTYDAYPDAAGRDTFTYAVRDRLGAVAESTVTVGVAAPGFENQAPYAVKDTVVVKPGRRVAVAVTANDSDPDGDEITIDPDGLTSPDGVDAAIEGGRVVLTAPTTPGDYTFTYVIADTFGATAQGALLVTVAADAPSQPPIARDDRVSSATVGSERSVDVAVLENDEDPDGTTDDLEVVVFDDDATVRAGGVVRIALSESARIVRYAITDLDGNTAQAFVFVPGTAGSAPALASAKPIVVVSGETVAIALADHVRVREGRSPRIATADSVRTGHSDGSPLITDEKTLSYTSAAGYYGADTLGLLVTDGSGPDDADGLSAFVAIPITVLPAENQSPTLRNAAVDVAPGEDAVAVNLGKLAFDPDEGDAARLTFSVEGEVPPGYTASISREVLSIRADADVAAGTTAPLTVRVSDGVSEPTTGTIAIRAVSSKRPLPVANDDVVAKANQGQTYRVDVLANDVNPFADRGPLEIVSARRDTGAGTVAVDGDQLAITPDASFFGTMIVTYRIADATGAPDRQAEARVTLTVQGKPDAPGVPTVTSIQDRTVVLAWTPPANNGAPISDYTVVAQNGYEKLCVSTVCTLDGLTNDVEYTFRVTARNEVGESDPSPVSAVARPDARPDTPAPPTLVFGDKSLAVSWATPRSTGSPVLSYNLEISPAPAFGPLQKTGVTGNAVTWEGLQNGVAYQVRVQAVNRAPEPSAWSPYSATMVPAGVPDAPGQPQASFAPSVGAQAQLSVSWAAPASSNGDAVADYTVTASGGDGQPRSQTVTGTSAVFAVGTSSSAYTFVVSARNKAGSSPSSAASASIRAANAPAQPASVDVEATGVAGQVNLHIVPGSWNGNAPGEVTWYWRGAEGRTGTVAIGSQSTTVVSGRADGAANGVTQQFEVWGVSAIGGQGASTTSAGVTKPFGPLTGYTPTVQTSGDRVCFTWNVAGALNGQQLSALSFSADGGDAGSGGVTGSACSGSGYYATRGFTMTLTTVEGNSATYTASGSTGANPNRTITVSKGGAGNNAGCTSNACAYISVSVSGWAPNSAYAGRTWTDCAGYGVACTGGAAMPAEMSAGSFTIHTDGAGNGTVTANLFGFPGARIWAVIDGRQSNQLTW